MLLIAVWQAQSVPAKGAGTDATCRLDKQTMASHRSE